MIVVGGTYDEICFEPRWKEKFGSGLRACRTIHGLDSSVDIAFHTFGDGNTQLYLQQIEAVLPRIKSSVQPISETVSFYYDHPLIAPRISPRLDTINQNINNIEVCGEDILYYGFIEGNAIVKGQRVVYDPQSPSNPISFSKTGSSAEILAVVVNIAEAKKLANTEDIAKMKHYFLIEEGAEVLVLKMGPKGALVFDKKNDSENVIPVYKTQSVWPIGSGDVFASAFAYYWFSGETPHNAALKASQTTALYCESKDFDFGSRATNLEPLSIKDALLAKVYLAGPFFTFAQRWLIDQIRMSLHQIGLPVFSPWHDIGHGVASEVVPKDLKGLDESKLVFAVIDGLDSGTLFEVGYAVKMGIPIIAYVENETEESVKMLDGTGCILEKDLTTAIYKAYWLIAENE
jgi:nucleoside 2-deoxyribosyltransferase